jgi:hypothetical protein
VIRVRKGQCHLIRKHTDGLVKRNAALLQITPCLLIVPLELEHAVYLALELTYWRGFIAPDPIE